LWVINLISLHIIKKRKFMQIIYYKIYKLSLIFMFYFMNFKHNIGIFTWTFKERMKCDGLINTNHHIMVMKWNYQCLFLYHCQYNLEMIQNKKWWSTLLYFFYHFSHCMFLLDLLFLLLDLLRHLNISFVVHFNLHCCNIDIINVVVIITVVVVEIVVILTFSTSSDK